MAEKEEATEAPKKKKLRKGLVIPAVILVIGLLGGGFFFVSGSGKKAAATPGGSTTTTTIALGQVVSLDPITLNLSDGHILKVGLALQLVAKPKDKQLAAAAAALAASTSKTSTSTPLDGQEAKAIDQAIHTLGDSTFQTLSSPGGREAAKEALSAQIVALYKGDITAVYFTDFVMS